MTNESEFWKKKMHRYMPQTPSRLGSSLILELEQLYCAESYLDMYNFKG